MAIGHRSKNPDEGFNVHWVADTNLMNLNGNLLTCVEIATTGSVPRFHDLCEITVLPLNAEFKLHAGILPYSVKLKPKRLENIDVDNLPKRVSKEHIYDCCTNGLDPYKACDLFDEWFEKIRFKFGKKLSILTYDWPNKMQFIHDFLEPTNFKKYFDHRYRDMLAIALFQNDVDDLKANYISYQKVDFQYLNSTNKVEFRKNRDTLQRAAAMAELYQKMVARMVRV